MKSSEKLGAGPKDIELKTFKTHSSPANRQTTPPTVPNRSNTVPGDLSRMDGGSPHPTFKDAQVQTDSASTPPKEMKDQSTQTRKPLPPIPQRRAGSEARPMPEGRSVSEGRLAQDPSILSPTPQRPPIPSRVESLEAGLVRQGRTREPEHAGAPQSPHPPRHQLLRHVHGLMKNEQNLMAGEPKGTEAHNLHKKNTQYLKRYEQILEKQGSSILASEQRQIEKHSSAEKSDLANLQAAIKPVEKDMGKVRKMLSKLEGEKAAIERQLAVAGAQGKGDKGPVKFYQRITNKGRTKDLASFDQGNSGKSLMGMFKRSGRLDKLSKEELQTRLASVNEDIGKASGWMKEYETEKAGLISAPRFARPTYDAISLPSREQILKMMHESQPLRKTPWKDPLTDLGEKVPNAVEGNPNISKPIAIQRTRFEEGTQKVAPNSPLSQDTMESLVWASKQPPMPKSALKPAVTNPDRPVKHVGFSEDYAGKPNISSPLGGEGFVIPEGSQAVPPNPPPNASSRPLPTPTRRAPEDARPPRSLQEALGASIQRPGNPMAGSMGPRPEMSGSEMMERLSQTQMETRPQQNASQPVRPPRPLPATPLDRLQAARQEAASSGILRPSAQAPSQQTPVGGSRMDGQGGASVAGSSSRPFQEQSWTQLNGMRSQARADLQSAQARHGQNPTPRNQQVLQAIQGHLQALEREVHTRDRNDEIHLA